MWNCNDPYADRNESLKRLGFKSYREYLRSPFWDAIRTKVLRRACGKCERCGSTAHIQVHHRAYDLATLAGASLDSLTAVCRGCHFIAERPDDRSRSRYERLIESSETVLIPHVAAPPTWGRICLRWYERHKKSLPHLLSEDECQALVGTIRARAAQEPDRCLICRRKRSNPRVPSKVYTDGEYSVRVCGHHGWGAIRSHLLALRLRSNTGQYPLEGRKLRLVDLNATATDGVAEAASVA